MNYRLLALDLDGTLINGKMEIQIESIEAIRRVRALGIEVMLVTGRHHSSAYPYWDQLGLDQPAVCCNGSYIYDYGSRQVLVGNPLSKPLAHQVLKIARQHGIYCMIYAGDAMAYETLSHHRQLLMDWAANLADRVRPSFRHVGRFEALIDAVDVVWKFDTASDDASALRAFEADVRAATGLHCEWTSDYGMDVVQPGISKGARLAQWLAQRGIDPAQMIAFGDHRNDVDMLALAGMGIAMGNADPVAKATADWVTGSNDETGIADGLNRFVFRGA